MQPQELRTLKILEAVEQEEPPSQRELARRLNVSLGLVNSFIKRLANKGYFKVTTIPKNRVKYMLTAKGMAEKTRLTYEYIQYSLFFYKDARRRLKALFRHLESSGVRKVVFFGVSDLAEIAYLSLAETGIRLAAVVDEKTTKEQFLGHRIRLPEELSGLDCDKIIITAADHSQLDMVALKNAGIPADKIEQVDFS